MHFHVSRLWTQQTHLKMTGCCGIKICTYHWYKNGGNLNSHISQLYDANPKNVLHPWMSSKCQPMSSRKCTILQPSNRVVGTQRFDTQRQMYGYSPWLEDTDPWEDIILAIKAKCKWWAMISIFWPSMYKEIDYIIQNCIICKKYRGVQPKQLLLSQEILSPGRK